jgi:hypothetical protein
MSWIEKELKRRQKAEAKEPDGHSIASASPAPSSAIERIKSLWDRFEQCNDALPQELRLQRKTSSTGNLAPEHAMFVVMLRSSNGSGIGFTGDAIRYVWPIPSLKKSNNFWIRARAGAGYVIGRRVGTSLAEPKMNERPFDERAVERIIKCLVTSKRVTWRSIRKRRFWLF